MMRASVPHNPEWPHAADKTVTTLIRRSRLLPRPCGDAARPSQASSPSRSVSASSEDGSDCMRLRGDGREGPLPARRMPSGKRRRESCHVGSPRLYAARGPPELVPGAFSSLSSSGEDDEEERCDEAPTCGGFREEDESSDKDDDVEDDPESGSEQPIQGGSFPHQYSSPKLPSFPRTLRRLLHALAKRLLQQPDRRAFTQELCPLSEIDSASRTRSSREPPYGALPSVGCTYTEAVRLVALLLKDVGPGGCVSPQLYELVDECVARAGGSCLQSIPDTPQRRRRGRPQSTEETRSESAAQAAEAVRQMENVQWQLWRDTAKCTSTMRGQICCQSIDRLITSRQTQAAVWEGSSKVAAWRLGASDCVAAAALVTAKCLLSLQLSLRSMQRRGLTRHSDEDEEPSEDVHIHAEEQSDRERGTGRRKGRHGQKLWEKALGKVPREIRAEVESALLFCLRKKKLSSCLALTSSFCRLFPSAPFLRDVRLELLLLQLRKNERKGGERHKSSAQEEPRDRLDTLFTGLFQLLDEEKTELERTRKALSAASKRFVKVHCGGEEALQRLSEFWECLKKRDRLNCLLLALVSFPS
ncbi:conserved hypothetical protein [Neospora caninum Liverpool]|uniref:Uncharacterized protein n=1 Tax=Neospora caninum (strain Liverpool) TaxID=572307 RepID=F0VHV4_NEOCL|nr:conserved hypothetical protein [Neospora caninum Liverpool]CBZ53315.1 conserved hypothetical protein [Neospora caninum Liverpool]|eukprot:XP_003883347.1 conserved hypothetical protein [Neospora caninum Liverpool]